jgi:transcriptional regulator with XRE-family HTH domain
MAFCLACLTRHSETSVGERLRARRRAAGLTLGAVAEGIGSQVKNLSAYERGQSVPQWGALVKLVEVLGLGLVDFRWARNRPRRYAHQRRGLATAVGGRHLVG